jgi:hypothetical protein
VGSGQDFLVFAAISILFYPSILEPWDCVTSLEWVKRGIVGQALVKTSGANYSKNFKLSLLFSIGFLSS